MTAKLAAYNYHVAPGDVLLLRSFGKFGRWNRNYQRLRRRKVANYTHVAIVAMDGLIVDATVQAHVRLRKWVDIERDYDTSKCRVARNEILAGNPEAQEQIQARCIYYWKQPYKITNLIVVKEKIEDQAGFVCSHLVAVLLADLGVNVSDYSPLETLPIDIDLYTSQNANWRQFNLEEYGMLSSCTQPHPSDSYWTVLAELSSLATGYKEQDPTIAADQTVATNSDAQIATMVSELMDESRFLESKDPLPLDHAFNTLISGTDLMYDVSKTMERSNRQLRTLFEQLPSLSAGELDDLYNTLERSARTSDMPHLGDQMLRQWERLYFPDSSIPVQFLHQEMDIGNTRRGHRDALMQTTQGWKQFASRQMELIRLFAKKQCELAAALNATGQIDPSAIVLHAKSVTSLLESGRYFGQESAKEIETRLNQYPLATNRLNSMDSSVDLASRMQAEEVLAGLRDVDVTRLWWRQEVAPLLEEASAKFQSIVPHDGANA